MIVLEGEILRVKYASHYTHKRARTHTYTSCRRKLLDESADDMQGATLIYRQFRVQFLKTAVTTGKPQPTLQRTPLMNALVM